MPEEDLVELKFRLYDGTDIGPFQYSPAFTVGMLKERIVTEWPKGRKYDHAIYIHFYYNPNLLDKKITPKTASDIKLISAGKILENTKTVSQCKAPFGEVATGVITMHVVVQLSVAKAKTEKKVDEERSKGICSCSIM